MEYETPLQLFHDYVKTFVEPAKGIHGQQNANHSLGYATECLSSFL